jgi:hypothetical protein
MGAVRALARTQTTIDTISWTPIVSPIYGNRIIVTPRAAGGNVKFRTNDADSSTERTVNAGISVTFETRLGRHPAGSAFGFVPAETVLYAKAVTGVGPVDVDWS